MKTLKFALMAGLAGLVAATAHAQFSPNKLAVLRAGDNGTSAASSLNGAHQAPAFVDQYDPVTPIVIPNTDTGTEGPLFSVAIPTNDPESGPYEAMWFNGHAGTEGYLALSEDLSSLTFTGYGGDILAQSGTPSQLNIPRGICVINQAGASSIAYEGSDWYGLGAGSQTNPRGVVSDDGVDNFWGSGSLDGTEWYNPSESDPPVTVQNLNSSRQVKIINGVFYTSLQEGDGGGLYPQGIYDLQTEGGGFPVTLPIGDAFFLNLVVPASAQYPNVEGFDMNPQRNTAYMADNTFGIQKYIEVDGNWTLACSFAMTNNTSTGTPVYPGSYTGCFGLVVDWSGANPVVFATTTEGNGGYANSNRLVRINDDYNFTDGQVHDVSADLVTLATGWSGNIAFRGLAWTPNLAPAITSNPASQSVVAHTPVTFTVGATAIHANTYEWFVNGVLDASQTTASYPVSSPPLGDSGSTYQVIVSNTYGAVTSLVANLTVTSSATSPSITSPVPALRVTNAVYDTITIPVTASGTTPLNYQWYQSTSPGSSTQLSDSGDFTGTATGTLIINASSTSDSGSYYVVINNGVGLPSSNLVAVVSVVTPLPVIFVEPLDEVAASNGVAQFTVSAYPLDATYQWYAGVPPSGTPVSGAQWSGSQTSTLTDDNVQESDGTSYYVVVSYNGGSVTSTVATLTVETPAPYSALPYTSVGSVYTQNFDTLPDPGTVSVNNSTITFPTPTTATIGGTNYNVSNPFDFAAPLSVSGDLGFGGLNLPTMVGWYSSDLGNQQIQATSGDNTTGLIVSFGCTNAINTVNPLYPTNNRALGMLSSPATSAGGNSGDPADGIFALRIRNLSGHTLTNLNLSYVSELWRNTLNSNIMTNWFYVDPFGTNTTPTNNWTGGLTNLQFSTNLGGVTHSLSKIYGTNAPIATTNMSFVNVPLGTSWPEGGILWIVWEETTALSGAQGIGIDNLVFSSGGPSLSISETNISGVNSVAITWPQMFTSYSLQYNSSASASGWQNVTISPPVAETTYQGMNIVTMPASGTQQYFRLMAP
ncbi:MAG: immunoglobulin domain-containing protein [Limisphaerales bacterium]